MSIEGRKTKLNQIVRGWVQYFKLSDMKSIMKSIDEWLRRRIRMITWKGWKKLGVAKGKAWQWANTRKSYWHIANSWILTTTLTNARFEKSRIFKFS